MWRASASMKHLVRNADGDQLLFIHSGEGEIYCDLVGSKLRLGIMSCFRRTMWRVEVSSRQCVVNWIDKYKYFST